MPPRPPACCKAVQRQLLTPSDSIWVSDEALSIAFQHFCSISRTSRRYASFVPGPMESRRRLGKRRMTHVSEGISSPGPCLGSIWGSFWETDRTQWQWQAPTPRPSNRDNSAAALPSWLFGWDTIPQEQAAELDNVEGTDAAPTEGHGKVEDNIRRFRETIKITSGKHNIRALSLDFAGQLKKSLSLGLVSSETLGYVLQHVSTDILESFPNQKYTNYLLLAFYNTFWEGLAASNVFGPTDIDAKVMNRLVCRLAAMPTTAGVHALAHKILHSASDIQLRNMEHGITSLVQTWLESFCIAEAVRDGAEGIRSADLLVTEAVNNVVDAQTFAMALERGPSYTQGLDIAKQAISDAYAAVSKAIDATAKAEDIISPLRVSVKALALALENLPHDLLATIIVSCTRYTMAACEKAFDYHKFQESSWSFRHRWLDVVAQISGVDDSLFLQTWKTVDASNSFRGNQASELILKHWISQGKLDKATAVTNTFMASSQERFGVSSHFAKLLLALEKHRQLPLQRTYELWFLLRKLGRDRQIFDIILRMIELHMKIPTKMLRDALEMMSPYGTRKALAIYRLANERMLETPLHPEVVPNFVLNLIDCPRTTPSEFWSLFDFPIYNRKLRHPLRIVQPPSDIPLSPEMIDLLHKMAIAFARSKSRPPRVAFRNVCLCYIYLSRYRAPVSPEFTRAVTHATVTRSIMRGDCVGKERLRYALSLVDRVEGEGIAKEVDEAIYKWRSFIEDKRSKLRRDTNPLRLGPMG